jgi:hypothetical protein
MTDKMHGLLIASLSAIALVLAANETSFAQSAPPRGVVSAPSHSAPPAAANAPSVARPRQHHHHRGSFWPAAEGYFDGPSYDEPIADIAPPVSRDARYTCTLDIPWDWVHRCPPSVTGAQ